jgi:hypothetical protein
MGSSADDGRSILINDSFDHRRTSVHDPERTNTIRAWMTEMRFI